MDGNFIFIFLSNARFQGYRFILKKKKKMERNLNLR